MRTRTGYSFKFAAGHLKDVADRLQEIGWKFAPISDRCSTFGFTRWSRLCSERSLTPLYGVELAVVAELGTKRPVVDYWTFFAKDRISSINELVFSATSNSAKEPCLLYAQALAAKGVIRIAGERCILEQVKKEPDLYFALSPSLPKGQFEAVRAAGHSFVACSDNVYPTVSDREFYRLLLGRRANDQTYPQYILNDKDWRAALGHISKPVLDAAIKNRDKIAGACKAHLDKAELYVPKKTKSLRKLCEEGAKRLRLNLKDPVYRERLNRELALIAEKKFEDYFYIIADIVGWARKRMIVGPARGSSCGSLVCYLLDITTVDPIKFNLIFERFIDINRNDLPDIDIDFSDSRRQLVFDYAEGKFGAEHVARLGTVGLFKPRSALKAAGDALDIPRWRIDRVLEGVIKRSGGDARALQALGDTLTDTDAGRQLLADYPYLAMAERMEGHPNNASQHAAGIVVTRGSITETVAVDARTKSAMCDKYDAESLDLLKIDALGLTQLSIFERTLELIGQKSVSGWLEKLPLDDVSAFNILNSKSFSGVFQFNGTALRYLTTQVVNKARIDHIEDIVALTSLARPGPMATGGATTWVKRKLGLESVSYPHQIFEPELRATLGVVVYQEQVMNIGRNIGDLSWPDVTALRKAMSKSLGKEYFDKYGDKWKENAAKKGVPKQVLDKVWDDLCAYGSWAFNRSHAVAYGIISYWCCWLKAHHPLEFAAATLDAEKDPERQITLLRELSADGIDYLPVDIEHSTDRWQPVVKDGRKVLVGPLGQIKGVGAATTREILTARERGDQIRPTLIKKLAAATTEIGSLFPVQDAINRLVPDLRAVQIVSKPKKIQEVQVGTEDEVVVIGVLAKLSPKDENEEVNVAKRGYKLSGPTRAVNLFLRDDTDQIFCKIGRFEFSRLGEQVLDRGKTGKAVYAIKGKVPRSFRMISVSNIKYLGDM